MKTFVLNSNKLITEGCILGDKELIRYDIEQHNNTSVAGNIYKGRMTNVNKQKKIGFVDIGLEKNGMINFKDATEDVALIAGQDLLVQVISDPYEEKGAKLTTELSFQGTYLVLLSGKNTVAVSRKIVSEEKRQFLKEKLNALIENLQHVGVIVRTEAADAPIDALVDEFQLLLQQMQQLLTYRVLGKAPRLLRAETGLLNQYAKRFNSDVDKVITNDAMLLDDCYRIFGKKNVVYYAGHPIFDYAGCKNAIDGLRAYRLPLKNGGELVIDYAEACTVIDVNSGKDRRGGKKDVLWSINCEAMKQTKWFLEKAGISGAIMVDLIGMKNGYTPDQILEEARRIFKGSDSFVAGISALGFLEITRKRTRQPAHKIFQYRKPNTQAWQYETNILFHLKEWINEVRRLSCHHSSQYFKFLCQPAFIKEIEDKALVEDGHFYENKEIQIILIEDNTLEAFYKTTY